MRHSKIAALTATLAATAVALPAIAAGSGDAEQPPPPRSVAPVAGKTITTGVQFTFQVRSRGNDAVFVVVSRSKKKADDGTLRKSSRDYLRKMGRRKGTLYTKKVEAYRGLTTHFLNRPGTYYWQAHRIDCAEQDDCRVEGPVRRFTVKNR